MRCTSPRRTNDPSPSVFVAGDENLRHAIHARKINERLGDVLAFENARIDLKSARKIQLLLKRVASVRGSRSRRSACFATATARQSACR